MADNKDIFAPPSEDELKLFALPEIIKSLPQDLLGGTEAASRSFLEDLTLGYSGELLGGLRAGGEKLTDILSGKQGQDFLELYKQRRAEEEKALKELQEQYPTTSTIAGTAGIVLPALATAGAGLAAGGTKAAIKEAIKGGAKETGKLIAKGAGTGAGLGALQAIGKSEASLLEDPNQVGKEAFESAKAGAVFGGALPLVSVPAGKTFKWLGEKASKYTAESPLIRQAKMAYRMGKTGETIAETDIFRTKTALKEKQAIEGLTSKILQADEALGKTFGQIIDDSTTKGVKIPLGEPSINTLQSINNLLKQNEILKALPETGKFMTSLNKVLTTNDLSPREAYDLKKYVQSLTSKIDVPGLKQIGRQLQGDIDSLLGSNVQGFTQVNQLFSKFRESVPETLIGGSKYFGDIPARQAKLKLEKSVQGTLESLGQPGYAHREPQRKFAQLIENVKELEKENPGLLQSLGLAKSSTAFEKGIRSSADEFALVRQALGFEPQHSVTTNLVATLTASPATSGRGLLLDYANRMGNITKMMKPASDVGRKAYSAPVSVLQALGKELEGSGVPGLSNLGTSLVRGLNEKNSAMKNAILFSLLQNPEGRLFLNKFIPGEEEE